MSRYWNPIKWVGGVAVILIIFAVIFREVVPGTTVLLQAIPFFAIFAAIILTFALLIVLAAIRFNGRLPYRAYRPIEVMLIVGIAFGVVSLFQPFVFAGFRFGFPILLVSTLGFILWSHVIPRGQRQDQLPPHTPLQHIIGAVLGVAAFAIVAAAIIGVVQPVEPYGVRERLWNTYDDARKADIAAAALAQFNERDAPYILIMSLLPGLMLYFIGREAAGALTSKPSERSSQPARQT